jgi:hypothetical protein
VLKVLASFFHVSTYFDRVHDTLFNQYVIETLFGPPLMMRDACSPRCRGCRAWG